MAYQALYRKFRPEIFNDVCGQDPIVTTLKNQIKTERIGHAYLFCGTRGTGKTTVAKIFARAVNCESPKEDGSPCMECSMCKGIQDGSLLNVIEIDAASNNGVEDIRTIVDEVSYSPARGRYKVYIIDEVHMLSTNAFNALLKTLEEPPGYVIFILATTEPGKLPITILSRCQRYDFRRMSIETMTDRMRKLTGIEGNEVEDRALSFIARLADGSMRDALSLLDRCLAFNYGQNLTYDKALDVLGAVDTSVYIEFVDHIIKNDLAGTIKLLDDNIMRGREIGTFVNDLIWHLRNMLLISTSQDSKADIADVLGVSTDTLEIIKESAKKTDPETLMRYIRVLSDLSGQLKYSSQKRVLTEIAIVKLLRPRMDDDMDSVRQRLAQVERKVNRIEAEGIRTVVQESAKPKVKPPAPEALEADVKLAVYNWKKIIESAERPVNSFLERAVPSTDGRIFVIKCHNDFDYDFLKDNLEIIDDAFIEAVHKKVQFRLHTAGKAGETEDGLPDLSDYINFEIDENPDDPDDPEEEED
ncbi:MAG: DNA polymerase III subunit gamma/tau [Lachnospiraceae bacterium]|nr:DNA polymerase III subunit gamma/tau [Lachnospiraceae bacterium]